MDLGTLCTLPNLFFVRTGYAARSLRKLLTICESQARAGGQFRIDTKDLKFVEYMTSLADVFSKVHAANNSQVARAFSMVLSQMRAQALKPSGMPPGVGISELGISDDPPSARSQTNTKTRTRQLSMPQVLPSQLRTGEGGSGPVYLTNDLPYYATSQPQNMPLPQQDFDPSINFGSQPQTASWFQGEVGDSYMTGLDVLQWFGQDFMFDGVSTFGYDDTTYPAGNTQGWQQQ